MTDQKGSTSPEGAAASGQHSEITQASLSLSTPEALASASSSAIPGDAAVPDAAPSGEEKRKSSRPSRGGKKSPASNTPEAPEKNNRKTAGKKNITASSDSRAPLEQEGAAESTQSADRLSSVEKDRSAAAKRGARLKTDKSTAKKSFQRKNAADVLPARAGVAEAVSAQTDEFSAPVPAEATPFRSTTEAARPEKREASPAGPAERKRRDAPAKNSARQASPAKKETRAGASKRNAEEKTTVGGGTSVEVEIVSDHSLTAESAAAGSVFLDPTATASSLLPANSDSTVPPDDAAAAKPRAERTKAGRGSRNARRSARSTPGRALASEPDAMGTSADHSEATEMAPLSVASGSPDLSPPKQPDAFTPAFDEQNRSLMEALRPKVETAPLADRLPKSPVLIGADATPAETTGQVDTEIWDHSDASLADAPNLKADAESAARDINPTAYSATATTALADFPASFNDSSPEGFFIALPGEEEPENEDDGVSLDDDAGLETGPTAPSGEKRRRSRSRRSRGRKKSAAQAAAAQAASAADGQQDEPQPHFANGPEDDEPHSASEDPFDDTEIEDDADAGEHGGSARKGDRKAGGKAREEEEDQEAAPVKAQRRKMFVSVLPEEQVEVVITEEGQVQEYYVEMLHQAKTKGNIYKAVIHNVDPNLQAAFVSYGATKNGFLQIDEIHPEYYVTVHDDSKGRKYPPIQKVIKPGQEVLVQVVKEPAGTKGAFLTTYLSLPGRFLVLTPGREQIGVSRKVENEGERSRLRELLEGLSPGAGLGVIVRTVSMGASKTSLQRDLQYLKRTWKDVRARGTTEKAPCLIYQEEDLTARAVRDYLTEAVGEVWIDDEPTASAIAEIAEALFPRKQSLVRAHKDPATTLFERFNLQRQLDQIHSREVSLPSGGRLVIDPTEALTAIDINSGRSGGKNNFEDMAYRTNMEAAKMIPLQLRLRDIGGQIVADFIEMRDKSHWREVEKTLRNGMKVDRARYDVGKIGPFGMLEIVRQRLGSSAISVSTEPCPCCNGTGVRRNMEWQSQHALRDIHRALRNAQAQSQTEITYQADQPLALHLLNNKRQRLLEMEQSFGIHIDIRIKFPEIL